MDHKLGSDVYQIYGTSWFPIQSEDKFDGLEHV